MVAGERAGGHLAHPQAIQGKIENQRPGAQTVVFALYGPFADQDADIGDAVVRVDRRCDVSDVTSFAKQATIPSSFRITSLCISLSVRFCFEVHFMLFNKETYGSQPRQKLPMETNKA